MYRQVDAGVRFEWGASGAEALVDPSGALVVIDVLSFTTSVTVAVERGAEVYPYRWRDDSATAFAHEHEAQLAVGRHEVTPQHPWSLSPAALAEAPEMPDRLVLPSPNGSTIAATAASSGALVVAAALRNASAVAEWLHGQGYGGLERPVVVVAAGELWESDNTLRPAAEDLLGAGAVIDGLARLGSILSMESTLAARAWSTSSPSLVLADCSSGRELTADGYEADVLIAGEVDASRVVPVMRDGAFVDAPNPET